MAHKNKGKSNRTSRFVGYFDWDQLGAAEAASRQVYNTMINKKNLNKQIIMFIAIRLYRGRAAAFEASQLRERLPSHTACRHRRYARSRLFWRCVIVIHKLKQALHFQLKDYFKNKEDEKKRKVEEEKKKIQIDLEAVKKLDYDILFTNLCDWDYIGNDAFKLDIKDNAGNFQRYNYYENEGKTVWRCVPKNKNNGCTAKPVGAWMGDE